LKYDLFTRIVRNNPVVMLVVLGSTHNVVGGEVMVAMLLLLMQFCKIQLPQEVSLSVKDVLLEEVHTRTLRSA
jgi:hypothetical protein